MRKHIIKNYKKKLPLLISSYFIDLAFIISFFYIYWQIVYVKIFSLLVRLSEITDRLAGISEQTTEKELMQIALETGNRIIPLRTELFIWTGVFLAAIFCLWIIFQGPNFLIASKTIRKTDIRYLIRFAAISGIFYSIMIILFALTIYLAFIGPSLAVPLPMDPINWIFMGFTILLAYFCLIALVAAAKKKIWPAITLALHKGTRKALKTIPVFLAAAAGFITVFFILSLLFKANIIVFYLGVFAIFFPWLVLSRILFFRYIDKS